MLIFLRGGVFCTLVPGSQPDGGQAQLYREGVNR